MKSIVKFWDKFIDDEELIKFKLVGVTIVLVFGQIIL